MKRHIGKLKNTDQRIIVVFMQLPERPDHALIVSTDNLNPRLEQAIIDIVDSDEGQNDAVLANVLARRLMPDSNMPVLQVLHESGLLRTVHVDQVVMYPRPNMPFPLRDILEQMSDKLPIPTREVFEEKFNPHLNNVTARSDEERLSIAKNLLVEADLLSSEAEKKRQTAYSYAPELNPKANKAERKLVEAEKVIKPKTTKRTTTARKAKTA
jgi:hypothetical protein